MLTLGSQAQFIAGCVHGLKQPCWAFSADSHVQDTSILAGHLEAMVEQCWPSLDIDRVGVSTQPQTLGGERPRLQPLQLFLVWSQRLHAAAGLPFVNVGKVLRRPSGALPFLLLIPTVPSIAGTSLRAMLTLHAVFQASWTDRSQADLVATVDALRNAIPGGANVPHLLRHAANLDIPALHVDGGVYQFGHGHRSCWLDSTFTQHTSRISANLARDKVRSARVLRLVGLPVPRHQRVNSAEEATQAALVLGGAVVVKPADLDGGVGVLTDLRTSQQIEQAYDHARAHSPNVLVEEHLDGRDYRLVVFQGELIWAIERVPASVLGDGVSSVAALLQKANTDPRRYGGTRSPLRTLVLDAEALSLLAERGLHAAAVPAAGMQVRLRRAANVASGGWPVGVLDQVHADNRSLAIQAAAALRLDLAGIDFITQDISRSWHEVGGGICEVNAQPNIGVLTADHLFALILGRLVPMRGRIPLIVVLGVPDEHDLARQLSRALQTDGHRVGLSVPRGTLLNDAWLERGVTDDHRRCRALLMNPQVSCIVLQTSDPRVMDRGLPVDRVDILLAGPDAGRREPDGRDLLTFFLTGEVGTLCRLSSLDETAVRATIDEVRTAIRSPASGAEPTLTSSVQRSFDAGPAAA